MIRLIHDGTNPNTLQVWTQICLNVLFLCQTTSCQADRSGIWYSTILNNHSLNLMLLCFPCRLMISPSPLLLKPPVDKSFSFIAQTQGLQVHRPQKRIQGCSGGGGVGMGKRMVSRKIRGERNRAPYSGLTSTSAHPSLHPCLHPSFTSTSWFCSAALPHVRRAQTASVAAWRCQVHVSVCGFRQEWQTDPFLLNQQRSSNDFTLQLCLLRSAILCPAEAPHQHLKWVHVFTSNEHR